MDEREIEIMKQRIEIYRELLKSLNDRVLNINYSVGFGSIDKNVIDNIGLLKEDGNKFLKYSDAILRDIDDFDPSVIGIKVNEINENRNKFIANFVSLENNLITRYNKDIIGISKRIDELKERIGEYPDLIKQVDSLKIPGQCDITVNNYNTVVSSNELNYSELDSLELEIEKIENGLNIKRDKEIEEIEKYILYFNNRLESNIPFDLISLRDLSNKVTKNGISNKITNDEKKINEVLLKLEKIKDKLSDDEYNTYFSVIADKAVEYSKLRQELMGIDVKSYKDEIKREYNLVKNELLEFPKKIDDLMVSQVLPLTKEGELGEGPLKFFQKIVNNFESSLSKIKKIIEKCHEMDRFDNQLYHNLMVYYELAENKLNEIKNVVNMSSNLNKEDTKEKEEIVEEKTNKVYEEKQKNDINVNKDEKSEGKEVKKPLQVIETKKVSNSFMNRFSKGGLLALGFSVLCVSIHSPLGSILIPALILANAAYAVKEPILKPVNEILGKSIGAKKNKDDEWVNSNGVAMNSTTPLLKAIAASGCEKVPVIKKLVSGVKNISKKTSMIEDKKVLNLYKEYCECMDEISLEDFCNEKKLTDKEKEKLVQYVNNMEYIEVKGRSK